MKKQRLLITGISGLLGSNIAHALKDHYEIWGFYHAKPIKMQGIETRSVDLRYKFHSENFIKYFKPDCIIHCAAQANVDVCEEHQELAWDVNVKSTANILSIIEGMPTKFIYISTDLVYDGTKGNYRETDEVGPRNYYAKSKLEGEKLTLARPGSLVLRTNFFGWNITSKRSLAEWVIDELSVKKSIMGFQDAIFSSIYTLDLAAIIDGMIQRDLAGVYNCVSSSSMLKYDFLINIAKGAKLDTSLIKPASIDEGGLKAARSKNLSLSTDKLAHDLGKPIPTIEESIAHFINDLPLNLRSLIPDHSHQGEYYPFINVIPYGRQCLDDEDIQSVLNVLKSSNLTQGPKIEEFECGLVELTTAGYAVAVNSATSALHVACMAAGVTKGDEVITSSNTFVASANCAVYCGARPVLTDIDPLTYNMSLVSLKALITAKTKAVIPVHFAGQSCPMKEIQAIVQEAEKRFGHKIYIIEDASHALGSTYLGSPVGSCKYSDMTVMSFHPVKHITTAEGGALLTNDKQLHRKCMYLRSHGITSFVDEFQQEDRAYSIVKEDGQADRLRNPWYYEQQWLGYNYRITDLQCALGVTQLKKIDRFKLRRREIVTLYHHLLSSKSWLTCPVETDKGSSNFHLFVVKIDFKAIAKSRVEVMNALRQQSVITQVHYIPVHTHPFFQQHYQTRIGDLPVVEAYYAQCLSLPLYPGLSDQDVHHVVNCLVKVVEG